MNEEETIKILKIAKGNKKDLHVYQNSLKHAIETVLNFIEQCKSNVKAKNERLLEYAEELEKKDKIIDLMSYAMTNEEVPQDEYCIFRNMECEVVGGNRECKQCIKQYFERKIEQ